jgi:predicted alpha-1,2-mannosidase
MKFLLSGYVLLLVVVGGCITKHPASVKSEINIPVAQANLTPFESVNPFIGTGGHGHTYPGATSPFGMVQLSPDTRLEGWDGCSGYHYTDSLIYGFSHTHLQGTGVADYCDILFMPTNHRIKVAHKWNDAYKSHFDHNSEQAQPGYYKVHLDDYNIDAELTTTPRTGIHRYTFSPGDSCRLFIDMMHRDELLRYDIQTIGDTVIYGYRISKGWAEEQHCYFYAVFSEPFHDFTQLDLSYVETDDEGVKKSVLEQVQVFSLQFEPVRQITVKVGISGVDCEGAKKNLHQEAQHWDFNRYRLEARKSWEQCLEKAKINDSDPDEMAKYYTSLYHCYTVPNLWSDVDSRYRGEDKKIHTASGYKRYTVFSLWDTFRAYHPLMSVLEPEITRDWIVTFLEIYKERGELPVWELAGNETYCMIGYHSVPVILDAYRRGITNFDHQLALQAMVASASGPQEEKKAYEELGYVPADRFSESVSKTLEFAYDDWCIAQFAKELGDEKTYTRFIARSQSWKNLFDSETGFMRPRRNGGFPEPFDPFQVDFNFTEANSWQYSFFVPHDIQTLIEFHGGNAPFSNKLNSLFTVSSQTTGREQSDITGLIGQYAHGNEPSHHAAFLFNYLQSPEEQAKTTMYAHKIMKELYSNSPDGLCGNEDCGQMSAWYVLAKNNLYPLCPGKPEFVTAHSGERMIVSGSSNLLNQKKAVSTVESAVKDYLQVPAPVIIGPQTSFSKKAEITIYCADPMAELECEIHKRRLNPETGDLEEIRMRISETGRISISEETDQQLDVYCVARKKGFADSKKIHAVFRHSNMNMQIISSTPYDNQYTGGGTNALIDGIRGGTDFRTGSWQGWRGKDVELVVDLGKEQAITTVGISCLEEIKSWIWFPSSIDIFISHDGTNFGNAGSIQSSEPLNNYVPSTKEFTKRLRASGRYVKLVIHPGVQPIPKWHLGAGESCWIFADEIIIK